MVRLYFFLTILTLSVIILSCGKNQLSTRPNLTFNSASRTVVDRGETITFTLGYTDREGDIFGILDNTVDTCIYVEKDTRNCPASNFVAYFELPAAPDEELSKGEIQVRFSRTPNTEFPPLGDPVCEEKNDSCVFRFVLRDREGNVSDTVSSPEIVLIK